MIEVEGVASPKGKILKVLVAIAVVERRIFSAAEIKGRALPADAMRDGQIFPVRD